MKRAIYHERGPTPATLIHCEEMETPALQAGEALIEVLATPINPSDVLTIAGLYGVLPSLPAVGGNEGIGRVAAVSDGVSNVRLGQRVLLPVGAGTWSTHMIAPAATLMPLPDVGDPVQLSMLTVNPPTAALLLSEFVTLAEGDWVIQNAANSAVGGYLIQLAKRQGVRTVNVVRRESAVAEVQAIGGDVVLVDGPDLKHRIAEATGKAKIRLAIDAVGGKSTDYLAQSVAIGGTVVNYGGMSGQPCTVLPSSFVFRDVTLRGFWLAFWFRTAAPERQRALFGELATLIATGHLSARVQATYPLEQIQEAIAAAAAGERNGKIVLVPNGDA